jgi:hypothetical protein
MKQIIVPFTFEGVGYEKLCYPKTLYLIAYLFLGYIMRKKNPTTTRPQGADSPPLKRSEGR